MRVRAIALALVALLASTSLASAQGQQTGEIFGRAIDQSGAVLPGVTVTLTAPALLQPLVAVTSETGSYQFPRLEIGVYAVKFELTGFKTVVNEAVRVTVGFSAQINATMGVSTVQETITVTGASPIVDTKETGTKQTFTNELLQSIPSARDPWVILQQTAGIAMDRENVGGNASGQQSNYVSRGGNPTNNKWTLDGVDITDMSATGSSPTYYDFDMFEEMTVSTGGVDVTQQTGGVGINLITRSGSDRFRGSGRFYQTSDNLEANNATDTIRQQGGGSGNPIQDIKDYGLEVGGPIKKGKAWIWGAYGTQNVNVGVVGFYQPTASCQQIKSDIASNPLSHSVEDVNGCLNTDQTILKTTNLKGEVQLFKGNKLSLYSLFSAKQRNARNASDLTPIESTVRQDAVPSLYGTSYWITGPTPTYKFGDQWVLSDRLLLDVQYAHVGNNFILDYHDPSYPTQTPAPGVFGLQPTFITSTSLNGRSTPDNSQSVNIRPVNSITVNTNYFLPGVGGADHSFKIGGYWRDNNSTGGTHTPGNAVARFPTSAELANPNDCATLAANCQMQLTRDASTAYKLTNISLYGQDTITHGKATFQLGVRYDYNHDRALASSVLANPILPNVLPAVTFAGADPGIKFNNLSPRLGFSYNVTGDGKTVVHGNYAMYWGQVGVAGYSFQVNPVSRVSIRYPWVDLNHDTFVQANEIQPTNGNYANFLALTGNWNPAAPGSPTTANTIDPNLKNDKTGEFILGLDREIGAGFAVGANYIWRRYSNFQFTDTLGLDPSNFTATTYAPTNCPANDGLRISAGNCTPVQVYVSNVQVGAISTLTNYTSDQYNRTYNGFELTARKRMSNHWLMNTSFAYNSTIVNMNGWPGDSANGVNVANLLGEDPSNRSTRNGAQYDYSSAGSGIGNQYVNAKWLFKISGLYNLPYEVNVAANYNSRQGYPEEFALNNTVRPNGEGTILLLQNPVGETRLPNFQNFDFHVDRPIRFGTMRLIPALDIFNVFNNNVLLAVRTTQNATNANQIQGILAPRVARVGVRVTW
jgi:Carboxypeptidase regulatory-like domain/TonB-dependent Receptor Plug Domain